MCKKADLYFIALGKDPFRSWNFMSTMRPHFDEKDLIKESPLLRENSLYM
jgi:hypothetical protein